MSKKYTFIDLFAGIGGIRLGLEQACDEIGYEHECVFTSEIKPCAISVLKQNHPEDAITGDITKVIAEDIPDFDILCAGFPCQPFSQAGSGNGFDDEQNRGTLFFHIVRILEKKRPVGFILENVEGLEKHDEGKTLKFILKELQKLDYNVNYKLLNSKFFGVPQERKRVYIVGVHKGKKVNLNDFPICNSSIKDILEKGKKCKHTPFIDNLLKQYPVNKLEGKSIKDKRGGNNNIHSWDLQINGPVTKEEKDLLNLICTKRRMKKWAKMWGIKWMDGMPLTEEMISSFYESPKLHSMLERLTAVGYLRLEYPKKQVKTKSAATGNLITKRVYDTSKQKGYNIVTGKLSFEVNKVLDKSGIAPTLVATDMKGLFVPCGKGIRNFTLREGLRLCGYPENFKFRISEEDGFDVLGNTVVVPVIKAVALRLLNVISESYNEENII